MMPQQKSPRVHRRLRLALLIAFTVVSLFCIGLALLTPFEFVMRDRVIIGVRVFGQSLSGMTRAEAKQFLENKFGKRDAILARQGGQAITLRDAEQVWRVLPWEIGLRTDFGPVADQAVQLGHRGNILDMILDQAECVWLGCDLDNEAQFDQQIARSYLERLAAQLKQPAREASVRVVGLNVLATLGQNGRDLNSGAMIEKFRRRILGLEQGDISLEFVETAPLITEIEPAKTQAEAILVAPIFLTFNERAWAMDQGALAAMLSIQPRKDASGKSQLVAAIDHAQMVAYLKTLAREINQPARDARFHFDPATSALTPILPSQSGQTLDPEAAAKQLEQQIANPARVPGLARPQDLVAARTIALPVTITKPTIAMEDAPKFGIKELVSQGVSNFKGSAAGRIQNIRTTVAAMDGIVVPPGAVFSFDNYLPEVVEANGYDDAYIIFADRTVLGPGGGVCQVSTTIFRAAFWGGFPIPERWAHAYRVGFYEPPLGLDATVFAPIVDFKFKNDTDAYLLIQPKLDLKTTTLTFNFYGTKPNRTVEMDEPIKERIIPHGPAIYTDDPTLKKGVVKQVDFEHDGMDVTVWRSIKVDGKVIKRDKFFSRYDPWVARYLVGTKIVK